MTRTLTVVSSRARREARRCTEARVVDGLDELDAIVREVGGVTRLDLVGHSTRGHHYLRLGRDALDLFDPRIVALVTALRPALATIRQLRLLGCSTAVGPAARASMARLASLSGCVVSGTTAPLLPAHYDAAGFRDQFSRVLVDVRPVRAEATALARCGRHHPHLENAHVPHLLRSLAFGRAVLAGA